MLRVLVLRLGGLFNTKSVCEDKTLAEPQTATMNYTKNSCNSGSVIQNTGFLNFISICCGFFRISFYFLPAPVFIFINSLSFFFVLSKAQLTKQ